MTAFFKALEQGYSAEEVLGYISKALPQMSPMIRKAQRAGYPAQQIVGFLSKNFETEDRRGMSESERHAVNKRADAERTKYGLQLAGAAIATPLAARAAQGALARALPSSLQGAIQSGVGALADPNKPINPGATPPSNTGSAPSQAAIPMQDTKVSTSSQPPISPSIPNATTPVQAQGISNIPELITKSGLGKHIEELSKNVKDPKGVAAILYNKFPKEMQKLQKESGKPMEEAIAEYMGTQNEPVKPLDNEPVPEATQPEVAKTEEIQEAEPIKIEKGSVAGTSEGVGKVLEVRNGKALIDIDGKKHAVNEEELIQSPLPEKDLAQLYEDLTKGIEKETGQEISRNVEYAAYSPENNELLYKPHSGGFYVYDDISPEVADELVNLLTERRSTGQNHIGAWTKGTKSIIGSRMYDLIRKLQSERGGKGNEYRAKYQTIYGALEPAQEAKKRAYEERKKKAKKPRSN